MKFSHLEIQKTQGNWAKVEVINYIFEDNFGGESGEDCLYKELNRKTGWLKAIDNSGFPNIWFSVSGY